MSSQGPRPAMQNGQDGTGVWAPALARQFGSERPEGPCALSSTYRYAPRSSSGVQPAESEQCVVWRSARSRRVSVACFPPNIHSQTSRSLGARGLLCPKLKGVSTIYLPFDTKVTHSTNKVTQRLAGHRALQRADTLHTVFNV
eukprot:scaffold72833_cov79-Phaeocystis_antarctica.AAC.1